MSTQEVTCAGAVCSLSEHETAQMRELERVARGVTPVYDAFLTLACSQEEQAHTATDLLERETWALDALLARSGPVWLPMGRPTLRFEVHQADEPVSHHLELGRFSHLAALVEPTADEQALIAAREPCWARVALDPARQQAGQADALACSYSRISSADAVAQLGLARILSQIEAATRAAGTILLGRAQTQAERRAYLQLVEGMLHALPASSAPASAAPGALEAHVLASVTRGGSYAQWALAALYLTCIVLLSCVIIIAA